jgi:hypothetical protein
VLDNAKIAMGLVTVAGATLAGKVNDSNSLVMDTTRGMLKCDEDEDDDNDESMFGDC